MHLNSIIELDLFIEVNNMKIQKGNIKETLNRIVFDNNTRAGRIFVIFIQSLILISLVTFTIETIPDLSQEMQAILDIIETITIVIFTAEYILRIFVATEKFLLLL